MFIELTFLSISSKLQTACPVASMGII